VTFDGTEIANNEGDGGWFNTGHTGDRILLTGVSITGNTNGLFVIGAPGAEGDLTDVPLNVTVDEYGFRLEQSAVNGNSGYGIVLGLASGQENQVLARIGGPDATNEIANNTLGGILMRGGALTGATIVNNLIHDNGGPGLTLASSVIVPLYVPEGLVTITLGLGFVQNEVNHNAMAGAGCTVAQSAPQIFITGPTAVDGTQCENTAVAQCAEQSDAVGTNYHCVATSTDCFVAHDLRGDLEPNCPNGLRNAIYGYNVSDGANAITVAARAEGGSAADLSNNEFQHSTSSQNVSQGAGSFIQAELTCGTRGCGN
jgi:hypothetical protein